MSEQASDWQATRRTVDELTVKLAEAINETPSEWRWLWRDEAKELLALRDRMGPNGWLP